MARQCPLAEDMDSPHALPLPFLWTFSLHSYQHAHVVTEVLHQSLTEDMDGVAVQHSLHCPLLSLECYGRARSGQPHISGYRTYTIAMELQTHHLALDGKPPPEFWMIN